jgi:hypothetical protein
MRKRLPPLSTTSRLVSREWMSEPRVAITLGLIAFVRLWIRGRTNWFVRAAAGVTASIDHGGSLNSCA